MSRPEYTMFKVDMLLQSYFRITFPHLVVPCTYKHFLYACTKLKQYLQDSDWRPVGYNSTTVLKYVIKVCLLNFQAILTPWPFLASQWLEAKKIHNILPDLTHFTIGHKRCCTCSVSISLHAVLECCCFSYLKALL